MDEKTREALEGSIKHWEENLAAENAFQASVTMDACSLCELFYMQNGNCEGCPVAGSGFALCDGSPYDEAFEAFVSWRDKPYDSECLIRWQDAAKDELDFLVSLRPKDSQEK